MAVEDETEGLSVWQVDHRSAACDGLTPAKNPAPTGEVCVRAGGGGGTAGQPDKTKEINDGWVCVSRESEEGWECRGNEGENERRNGRVTDRSPVSRKGQPSGGSSQSQAWTVWGATGGGQIKSRWGRSNGVPLPVQVLLRGISTRSRNGWIQDVRTEWPVWLVRTRSGGVP